MRIDRHFNARLEQRDKAWLKNEEGCLNEKSKKKRECQDKQKRE